jgi:hypothetical protein
MTSAAVTAALRARGVKVPSESALRDAIDSTPGINYVGDPSIGGIVRTGAGEFAGMRMSLDGPPPREGSGPGSDPLAGTVAYGKNAPGHMRKHAQHIRTAARADGVDIPNKVAKPETQQAIKDYIQYVVDNPEQVAVGRYMSEDNAIWSRRGDLIIVRKSNGEWITALSVKSGGAAGGAPWNNPGAPTN